MARRSGRAAAPAFAPARHVALIAGMLFILAAANARPLWWSSAVPAGLIAVWLIGARGPRAIAAQALSGVNAPIFWCLLAMTACAGVSAAVAMDLFAGRTALLRCLVPLVIYLSVVGLRDKRSDLGVLVVALIAGSAVPLSLGLLAFYNETGIPDVRDLLYARFDVDRMASYMEVTFGNVGHVGMYTGLVAPAVLVAMHGGMVRRWISLLCGAWLCVAVANTIVAGSRTSWAVALVVSAALLLSLHRGRTVVLVAALLVGGGLYFESLDLVDDTMVAERVLPSLGKSGRDVSVEERMDSIGIGWETLVANPVVGVGPGLSAAHNVYSVPHQSVLMVASETGVFGGLAFLILNIVVLYRMARHAWRARSSDADRQRLLWIAGPATWLLGGLLAGLTFNMDVALLWVGICHIMLGLYGFRSIGTGPIPA